VHRVQGYRPRAPVRPGGAVEGSGPEGESVLADGSELCNEREADLLGLKEGRKMTENEQRELAQRNAKTDSGKKEMAIITERKKLLEEQRLRAAMSPLQLAQEDLMDALREGDKTWIADAHEKLKLLEG